MAPEGTCIDSTTTPWNNTPNIFANTYTPHTETMPITIPTIKPLASRTDAEKAAARDADKATHKMLRALAAKAHNKGCADCTSRSSGWGVLPHGVFVCIHCAQLHRHIGRHISQTKAFNTGTYLWYKDEVAAMRSMGNKRANALLASKAKGAPARPAEDASRDTKLAYVRNKYEKRRWFDPDAADPLAEQAQAAAKAPAAPATRRSSALKASKFNTKTGRRKRSLRSANKGPSDGWAAWGTTASSAYDSAHEAHQATASPLASPQATAGKKAVAEPEVDLLDFGVLAISTPVSAANAEAEKEQAEKQEGQQAEVQSGDYAKKQAFVLSVMRGTGPLVCGGSQNGKEKAEACRLFGPPTTATHSLGHVAPPQKVGGTGFFESFGLAS